MNIIVNKLMNMIILISKYTCVNIYIYIYIYTCIHTSHMSFDLFWPRPAQLGIGASIIKHYTILYYTILYYTILYYTILYYDILYYVILYYTILYYTILYYTILYYTILYYTILYYSEGCTTSNINNLIIHT